LKTRKKEEGGNIEKKKEIREHSELSLKKNTNFPCIILLPSEELFIKDQ